MRWQQPCLALALVASTTQCQAAPATDPACRVVHGELSAWNGTPSLRISANGQIFGVVPSAAHPVPAAITKTVDFSHSAVGRFTVCRVGQAKPNGMIYIWLKRVDNLKIVPAP
jgi:hypothetical protein